MRPINRQAVKIIFYLELIGIVVRKLFVNAANCINAIGQKKIENPSYIVNIMNALILHYTAAEIVLASPIGISSFLVAKKFASGRRAAKCFKIYSCGYWFFNQWSFGVINIRLYLQNFSCLTTFNV